MNFLDSIRAQKQLEYYQSDEVKQGFLEDGSKFWDVRGEKNVKPTPQKPSDLQTKYKELLDDEAIRLENALGRKPKPTELSNLRKTLGSVYIDDIEQQVGGINKAIRENNPNKLKFRPSKAAQKEIDAQQPGIFSSDPKTKSDQIRTLQTRGTLDGEFIVPEVLRQARHNLEIDKLKLQFSTGSIDRVDFDSGMQAIFERDNRMRPASNQKLVYDHTKWERYGTPKGPAGDVRGIPEFLAKLDADWVNAAKEAKFFQDETGQRFDRGHIFAAKREGEILFRGGSDLDQNLAAQISLADPNLDIDDSEFDSRKLGSWHDWTTWKRIRQWGNIAQGATVSKPDTELEQVFRGRNIVEAYSEFVMADDPDKINWYKRVEAMDWARAAHDPSVDAEGHILKADADQLVKAQFAERKVANYTPPNDVTKNPTVPKLSQVYKAPKVKRAEKLYNKIQTTLTDPKTLKQVAGVAGQSHNPFVNLAGDIVGTVVDGMAFAANPKDAQAGIDLALSAGQLTTTVIAGGVAILPIPGARPGAYAIMKLGDNIGKLERLWNMQREGWDLATGKLKIKPNVVHYEPLTRVKPKI
tara:strand:+ start:947 stop:2692 length:1746 start_codon:yes stop_codon:yes gene_type:complete